MDQKRIGSFLKELRKEKELTQEQLAERFNVSDRTASRWENGNNMPDLSALVELADYYDVDVREIIDGERKSEAMNQEEKMLLVAEYADEEKTVLLRRIRIISIIGLCSMVVGFVMMFLVGYNALPVTDYAIGVAEKIPNLGFFQAHDHNEHDLCRGGVDGGCKHLRTQGH